MGGTSQGFFKEGNIMGNIETMTADQLRERLMVAETLMKKLYNRNKDIELYHKQKGQSGDGERPATSDGEHELDILAQFKKREEKMATELQDKQAEIDKLKAENQELIRTSGKQLKSDF